MYYRNWYKDHTEDEEVCHAPIIDVEFQTAYILDEKYKYCRDNWIDERDQNSFVDRVFFLLSIDLLKIYYFITKKI